MSWTSDVGSKYFILSYITIISCIVDLLIPYSCILDHYNMFLFMVGIYISTYCECIRPRVGSHRLAFTTYATGLGPSCSHHPQISSPAPSPASTKTGGHFIGMAMGMSMTSDPQHHSMGGSMNGMSYSHGLFDCIYHTLHRPNFYSNEIIRKVVPAGSKDENGRRSLVANWTCWNLCSPRPAIRTSSCEKKWPSRSTCRNLVSR